MLSLVVDTNILFSYFWKSAYTKELLPQTWLYAPERAFAEIKKHESFIREKSGLSEVEFRKIFAQLREEIIVIGVAEYKKQLALCEHISDKDDIAFVALALSMDIPLWTNDKRLEHKDVLVVSTVALAKTLAASQPWIFGSADERKFLAQVIKTKPFKDGSRKAEASVRLAHRKAFG